MEIDYYANNYRNLYIVKTIFFGGGTPSLMDVSYIKQILDKISARFKVAADVEITLETNPGTVSANKLANFKKSGINRLSLGIQSFDDDDLKFLTRIHNKEEALQVIHNAEKIGFENISIDLIFNLPNQTKLKWIENLKIAVALPIKHISAYSLILEKGTILNKMVLQGKVTVGDESYDADLYETTQEFLLSSGFEQYEVSNFAKNGLTCKHNQQYWNYGDYLGFGTSAHSFVNGRRWWNYKSLTFYLDSVMKNGNGTAGSEILGRTELLEEFVMLSLRSEGLILEKLNSKFGGKWLEDNHTQLLNFQKANLLNYGSEKISLTQKGYALCDELLLKFSY